MNSALCAGLPGRFAAFSPAGGESRAQRAAHPRRGGQPATRATSPARCAPKYRPDPDGDADPGEIVWTWVPYEEDHSQGKDRPVLIVGRDNRWLLGLMLTSKDHTRDTAAEARRGRHWMDIGAGPWDRQGRPSQIRLDRVLRIDPETVRREGAVVHRRLFITVMRELAQVRNLLL